MNIFLQIVFWACVYGLVHTYVLYPLFLWWLARGKRANEVWYGEEGEWPHVSAIMAAYNEERVIGEKIGSLLASDYPAGRLDVYIGSDASSDGTNGIVAAAAEGNGHVHAFLFEERRGKPSVVNDLVGRAKAAYSGGGVHVLLLTDASVMLSPNALRYLVRHFKRDSIALVDAHMMSLGTRVYGISRSESRYISNEVYVKQWESRVWRKMLGPFGGCYALRADYYSPVPPTFLVDDFYITMRVFEQGGEAINELEAVCYEPIPDNVREEYRRKARISAGNFQNLWAFRHLLWPPYRPLGFAFLSHKVLRWLGPFFLLAALGCSGLLAWGGNLLYVILFAVLGLLLFVVPLMDAGLQRLGWHVGLFRHVGYFVWMNIALLEGFFNYLKGIKSNVWEPPKRL